MFLQLTAESASYRGLFSLGVFEWNGFKVLNNWLILPLLSLFCWECLNATLSLGLWQLDMRLCVSYVILTLTPFWISNWSTLISSSKPVYVLYYGFTQYRDLLRLLLLSSILGLNSLSNFNVPKPREKVCLGDWVGLLVFDCRALGLNGLYQLNWLIFNLAILLL